MTLTLFQKIYLAGIVAAMFLAGYGKVAFPAENTTGVIAAITILGVYGLFVFFKKINPAVFPTVIRFGLLAGLILGGEIISEYVLLPRDNTLYGLIEFGTVFMVYFFSGAVATLKTKSIRNGVISSVWTSMIATLIWVIVLLSVFFLFFGTSRQMKVFQAEGNYADFARSGKADFNTFITEDFMGAVFFHSLLSPAAALILGVIGGLAGIGISKNGLR